MKVPRKNTPVDVGQMVSSLIKSWHSLLGRDPTKEQIAMILAQNSLETNHRKAMFNFNVGNLMHMGSDSHDYFENQDSYGGKPFTAKFRSYSSLDEGVLDYLKLLYGGYPQAFSAAKSGDPKEYARALIANPQKQYYDPHVQKQYVAGMSNLYDQYLKSPEVSSVKSKSSRVALLQKLLEMPKEKQQAVIERLFHGKPTPKPVSVAPQISSTNNINTMLGTYLQMATGHQNSKQLYKAHLPKNQILIQVKSSDYIDSIEFARVLCAALEEELLATAYTHTDGQQVEVECSIHGPSQDCFETVQQLTSALASVFQDATTKIGGIKVETQSQLNQKSACHGIDIKYAQSQHRKFLLKFNKGSQ